MTPFWEEKSVLRQLTPMNTWGRGLDKQPAQAQPCCPQTLCGAYCVPVSALISRPWRAKPPLLQEGELTLREVGRWPQVTRGGGRFEPRSLAADHVLAVRAAQRIKAPWGD